jgi:uncharacterized metal-binding protein YceD (DUF177 family)
MTAHPEFSRLIAIEGITPDKIRKETVEASIEECAALARRFDLRELSDFKAHINIRRVTGGPAIRVEGSFSAEVVQTCVVSLQDVHARIEGKFDTFFTEDTEKFGQETDITIDDDETAPEMITNGMMDLGEIVAQYLSLEIDPYPRAPGVSLAAQLAEVGHEVRNSPFRVLEGLKGGVKEKTAAKPAAAPAKAAAKPVKAAKGVKAASKAKKPAKPAKSKKGKAK